MPFRHSKRKHPPPRGSLLRVCIIYGSPHPFAFGHCATVARAKAWRMASEYESELGKLVGFTAAGVVGAYFLNPVLPLFPPVILLWIALAAISALVWLYRPWVAGPIVGWASIIIGGGSLLAVVYLLKTAADDVAINAVANQRRCLAIQRDMLASQPRRSDGPDLFQALGCRPQGEGSVYAPPRRKRD